MPRLVIKSGYISSGNASPYMKYIAKREGSEIIQGTAEATAPQKKLINQILKDFPDTTESQEYDEYVTSPTIHSASVFISMALDANAEKV